MSEKLTLKELLSLIEVIKQKTGLNEQDISERLGYHSGHIAQIRNKGLQSPKFLRLLKREFEIDNVKEYMEKESVPMLANESAVVYMGPDNHSLLDIINRLTRTVESQQSTIHVLATGCKAG